MKKTLLLGSFAILGLMANAQLVTEPTEESLADAGLSSEGKVAIEGGTVFAEGDAGTIAMAYNDNWGITGASGSYKNVVVGDVELTLGNGAVGDTNPTFSNYADGVMSAGAVFAITPAADGWLTIFCKMNPNKQYVVFEDVDGPLSYTLGYSNGETTIYYTLPHDEYYLIDFEDYVLPGHELEFYEDETPKYSYFVGAGGELGTDAVKPNFPWKVVGMPEKFEAQETGFLMFNVAAGNTYYVSALGSKAGMGPFVLTESDEQPVVTYVATDTLPAVTFGEGAGVESIAADSYDVNAPVYNVMGQKVNNDYKGIVIKNGKKFIRK
ncbi:MAG: hypothetical protein J1E16_05300 [Muribaculaceae bacterium]|nr:hypothetical protein [Muribaculaceae bacterium]